jgi:hypothetical protein
MKRLRAVLFCLAGLAAGGCATVSGPAGSAADGLCEPTGWVDRVEEGWAVLEPDLGEEEEYLPVGCFPEDPREGTRVVDGRIDWAETNQMKERIRGLLEQMEDAK